MKPREAYAAWREPMGIGEKLPFAAGTAMPEMELQARWFAGQFPRRLPTTTGEIVEIIHLGVWNREPGPDFCEAVVRFDGEEPCRGSIEIDTHRRDWETHGHSTNPAFENVVLHLFVEGGEEEFFTRTLENRFVPQARLELNGERDPLETPPLAVLGRCSGPLAELDKTTRANLIEAAAHFRLQRKSNGFFRLVETHDWEEALFQSIAIALGYKGNKLPFQLLAQRIGLKTLRADPVNIEPLLFGCAGFLDEPSLRKFEPDTQEFLRELWDRWWKIRDHWQRLVLPKKTWSIAATRPANHPQRRLAALALMLKHWPEISRAFRDPSMAGLKKILSGLEHPYWSEHYTLQSKRTDSPVALLGKTRMVELLVNVAIPAAMRDKPEIWRVLEKVSQPLQNRKLKTAVLRLFGGHEAKVSRSVLQQQGLLQIYEDFCLRDLTDCARCPFPEKVLHWKKI